MNFKRCIVVGLCIISLAGVGFWLHNDRNQLDSPGKSPNEFQHDGRVRPQKTGRPENGERQEESGKSQSFQKDHAFGVLKAGGLALSVKFEDDPQVQLTKSQEFLVIEDLQLIYGHLNQFETFDTEKRTFKIDGSDVPSSKMIQFKGSGRYFPDALLDRFGYLSDVSDKYEIIIPVSLIDIYRKALDFKSDNKQAFEELDLLIPDPGHRRGDARSEKDPSDVFWFPETEKLTPEIRKHAYREFLKEKFRKPSILEIALAKETMFSGLPQLPEGVIAGKAMILGLDDIPLGYLPIIYLNGKWLFAVIPAGT